MSFETETESSRAWRSKVPKKALITFFNIIRQRKAKFPRIVMSDQQSEGSSTSSPSLSDLADVHIPSQETSADEYSEECISLSSLPTFSGSERSGSADADERFERDFPPDDKQQHRSWGQTNSMAHRFQYVLVAASVETKVNEDRLTYLNQCQPYEIKLKKLGELTAYRGVVFRTVVRLCFQDPRLQFSEREQLCQSEDAHPNESILQVDLPLSYGVNLVPMPASETPSNCVSFLWEPLKEVGLYIKVNCISTEFTPKEHGGEEGVPFRLLIETFTHPHNVRLHAAACQFKVLKRKSEDGKHKLDREKILKKTPGELGKLQPSYDCTVLSDISLKSLESSTPAPTSNSSEQCGTADSPILKCLNSTRDAAANYGSTQTPTSTTTNFSANFSLESVRRWLTNNGFSAAKTLWDFRSADLLRLGKDELIAICGLPEGIRLYNALRYKTFFILLIPSNKDYRHDCSSSPSGGLGNPENDTRYHPICLSAPSISEMTCAVRSMFYNQFPNDALLVECLLLSVLAPRGNSRIHVLLTEQLLSNLKDQTPFKAFKCGSEVHLEIVEGWVTNV